MQGLAHYERTTSIRGTLKGIKPSSKRDGKLFLHSVRKKEEIPFEAKQPGDFTRSNAMKDLSVPLFPNIPSSHRHDLKGERLANLELYPGDDLIQEKLR